MPLSAAMCDGPALTEAGCPLPPPGLGRAPLRQVLVQATRPPQTDHNSTSARPLGLLEFVIDTLICSAAIFASR